MEKVAKGRKAKMDVVNELHCTGSLKKAKKKLTKSKTLLCLPYRSLALEFIPSNFVELNEAIHYWISFLRVIIVAFYYQQLLTFSH